MSIIEIVCFLVTCITMAGLLSIINYSHDSMLISGEFNSRVRSGLITVVGIVVLCYLAYLTEDTGKLHAMAFTGIIMNLTIMIQLFIMFVFESFERRE